MLFTNYIFLLFILFSVKEIYYLSDVEEIQRDIITYGPIQTGYTVYEDFLSYKNGNYNINIYKLCKTNYYNLTWYWNNNDCGT